MKKIRVFFTDFWKDFDYKHNFIIDELRKRYEVKIDSQNPEYLFYSVFGNDYLAYNCIRIFRTGESLIPDFNLCDYAMGFDFINFEDRYIRYPSYLMKSDKFFSVIKSRENFTKEDLGSKKKFCNFVYSNSQASDYRRELFKKLNQYKKVDSGGKYLNNIGYIVKDKIEFQKDYKFTIACENSLYNGYITEKLMDAFYAHTIPIYWGNPKVSKEFNTKSFIDCSEYNNIEEVVKRVIEIDQNDEIYLNMMKEPFLLSNIEEKKQEFREFLYDIIEQPYEKAFRRNRSYWGGGI